MKKKAYKFLTLLLSLLIVSQASMVFAIEPNDSSSAVEKVEAAITAYEAALDTRSAAQILNEEAAAEQYQSLMDEISLTSFMSDDVKYPDYYGGAYINDDGNLVVKVLPTAAANSTATISDITGNPDIIIEPAKYSLNELLDTKKAIDEFLSLRDNSGSLDAATQNLLRSITAVILNEENGQIKVQIKELSSEKEQAFTNYFGDRDYVVFEEGEFSSTTSTWRPGGLIHNEIKQGLSIGWPAYYYDDYGDIQRGFVSAGHGLDRNESVYVWENNQYSKIGTCIESVYTGSGDCDGALVALDSGESISTTTAYNGITLNCSKYVIPTEGKTVFKEGSATDYTTGKLLSTSATAVYASGDIVKDVYYSSNYNQKGDSGGPVYYSSSGGFYAIGQTTGKDSNNYTWTCKMLNTLNPLDCSYIPL